MQLVADSSAVGSLSMFHSHLFDNLVVDHKPRQVVRLVQMMVNMMRQLVLMAVHMWPSERMMAAPESVEKMMVVAFQCDRYTLAVAVMAMQSMLIANMPVFVENS